MNIHWTNYHCHTSFCDGRAEAEEFVLQALKQNVKTLAFSGHAPLPFDTPYSIKNKDFSAYKKRIQELKNQYKNQITILRSLEIDYIPGISNALEAQFQTKEFDFLISSVHFGGFLKNNEVWFIDGPEDYFEDGFKEIYGKDIKALSKVFFKTSHDMINTGGFKIVGHIDKVFQHGNRYLDVNSSWYRKLLIELCEHARDKNLIVEINTKSFEKHGFFYPHQSFFKELNNLNIPITLNPDSHDPDKVCFAFKEAASALLNAGFKHAYEWDNGEWNPKTLTPEGLIF